MNGVGSVTNLGEPAIYVRNVDKCPELHRAFAGKLVP